MKILTLKTISVVCGLMCFTWQPASGQVNNNWHFGHNAALTFSGSGTPTPTTSSIYTAEGCASISDATGTTLFYTDGRTVYDATGTMMPNGTGLNGHNTSTHSATIVPHPGASNMYFIVTVGASLCPSSGGTTTGIQYSLVDMSNQGNGTPGSPLGDVDPTTINTPLLIGTISSEKVTVTCHSNGTDYWIITQVSTTGNFHAYLVNSSGINGTPFVSSGVASAIGCNLVGQIKVSPNGSRLAIANRASGAANELFDFNNATGMVTNPRQMGTGVGYGVEFSPNSNLLYMSTFSQVIQYDATQTTSGGLASSATIIHTYNGALTQNVGALQLGPNSRIYVANGYENVSGWSTFIDEIQNPDVPGIGCNYVNNAITLIGGARSLVGLPSQVPCQLVPDCDVEADFSGEQNSCVFSFVDISYSASGLPITGWFWEFGDGTSSNEQHPVHLYNSPGNYFVCLTVTSYNGVECCTDKHCIEIDVNEVCEDPCEALPESWFTTELISNSPCKYRFKSSTPTNAAGWYWDFGDGTTGTGKDVEHIFASGGSHMICLKTIYLLNDENESCCVKETCVVIEGCSDDAGKMSPGSSNSKEMEKTGKDPSSPMQIFPNPTSDKTTIAFELNLEQAVSLYITDIQGKVLKKPVENKMTVAGPQQINVDTGELTNGVYFVILRTGTATFTNKLLIGR